MIDPLAMPIFKPLWEAFPYLPGCFAAWRGMSLGEISASAYATADGERRPSDAIVDCMAKHAARSLGNDVGQAVKRYFSRNSAVLSANLHGIDCLPEMVQAVPFFGLDRLAMLLTGTDSIKDVIAFPKVQNASCLMSEAPGEVEEKQLTELSLKVSKLAD